MTVYSVQTGVKRHYLVAALLASATTSTMAETATFGNRFAGQRPSERACDPIGERRPRSTVESDASAPSKPHVLTQSGKAAFPWCVKDDAQLEDGSVKVRCKAISGKANQAGGVVCWWMDGSTYYVARANALKNNVSLVCTVDGRRETIRVSLNGKATIRLKNDEMVGVDEVGIWTKADNLPLNDNFFYEGKART